MSTEAALLAPRDLSFLASPGALCKRGAIDDDRSEVTIGRPATAR